MKNISRKDFISRSALLGAAGAIGMGGIGGTILTSCSGGKTEGGSADHTPVHSGDAIYIPEVGDKAIDGKPIRIGLIGCGKRGTGAVRNIFNAANDVSVVALADIFEEQIKTARGHIEKEKGQGTAIDDKKIYCGFDSYKKVCDDPDVDMVIITSAPLFHAVQTKYAIDKGKHVFCEKPGCIDAVSGRTMMAAVMAAKSKGLSILFGTQRHHVRAYNEAYKRVREGQIGRIVSAVVKWNQGVLRPKMRRPGQTDMELMLSDFNSWSWLGGDHIAEQMCHQIDVFQWFSHLKPISANAMGSQARRTVGNVYDNFSVDYMYEGGVRVHAQARQIDGCTKDVSETIYGTLGSWNSREQSIRNLKGEIIWKFDQKAEKANHKQTSSYVLEHIDLINHIRSGKGLNTEAETGVISALLASMGRESAYSGKEYKYDEYIVSDQSFMPEKLHYGNVDDFEKIYVAPKMGIPYKAKV